MNHRPHLCAALALALGLALAGCGGDGDTTVRLSFGGVVSGDNCFNGLPESATVHYDLTASGLAAGSAAALVDAQGATWTGQVGEDGSIEVRLPSADERFVIRGFDVFSSSSPLFEVTASCVSFRCCTTLTGTLPAGG